MAEIAVAAALILVEKVLSSFDQLLNHKKTVRRELENVTQCLRRIKAYLSDIDGTEGSEEHKERVKQIRDVAHHIEDVLEEFLFHIPDKVHRYRIIEQVHELVHTARLWNPLSSLQEILSEITNIKTDIGNIKTLDEVLAIRRPANFEEGSSSGSRPEYQVAPHIPDDEEIVGFEEHKEALIGQLIDGESRHMKIAVVGLGGTGKTILVKNVYESEIIRRQFDCRAWVRVPRSFDTEELIWRMLQQFCASRKEPIPSEDSSPQAKLRNYLQQKRYVLVLDDVWNQEILSCIQNALPSGSNSSRIIVTTQKSDVASSHCIHSLTGLPWEKAWELFCKKTFHGKCPPELVEWSQKIVKRCEGLPLAIVAVGSLLSKKQEVQKVPAEWKKVHDSLGSEIGIYSSLSIISRLLLPSYKDLPTNLKSYFLYSCKFPEDYSVDRGRLVRLWIAEGFVTKTLGKTLEESAEDNLNELVGRNLVDATRRDFEGRVRDCRVLNFVLDFIIQVSKEENFVSVLADADTSLSKKDRRLSINKAGITWPQKRDLKLVRSVFFFKWDNLSNRSRVRSILSSRSRVNSRSRVRAILSSFMLLRVLDLRGAPLNEFPEDIVLLTLLRYLSLRRTNIESVPKSIKKLPYLETLDLKQTGVTKLPKKINRLRYLCHLLVYHESVKNCARLDSVQGVEMFEGIGGLTNLQKLSLVKPDKNRKVMKELGDLIQLRKLGLIKLKREDGKDLCASIQKMVDLSTLDLSSTSEDECLDLADMHHPPLHLKRLYLAGRLEKCPEWITQLHSLLKVGLRWSRLNRYSSPLEILQDLPNLMELEMVDAFTGEELVFKAGGFKKLKILLIEGFGCLHTVVVQERAMPSLEGAMPLLETAMPLLQKLTLRNCGKLEMLPLGIHNLTHLEELLLYDMPGEFISRLQKTSADREMVSHIRLINSYVLQDNGSWSLDQNLS